METLIEDANNPYGVHSNLWRWDPRIDGPAISRFLEASGLPESAQQYLRVFTPRILGQSAPPTADGISTGLVIGKVQSGKTNSFLALAALASDNGFRLIIVLSGTKNILKDQTNRQVIAKLSRGARGWRTVDFEPGVDAGEFETRLHVAMSELAPRTLVITILKRTRAATSTTPTNEGIDRLAEFLENSDLRDYISHQPVLIIDDEADEAGLDNSANARRRGQDPTPSPTHSAILRLRCLFDRHFFVQYTATPQANLLVELSNELAPDFCELLHPGDGYKGASEFFPPIVERFIQVPQADIVAVNSGSPVPPESLTEAIQLFYVGCALEDHRTGEDQLPATRSMLVHPERRVSTHTLARRWVQQHVGLLLDVLTNALREPSGPASDDAKGLIQRALQTLHRTLDTSDITAEQLIPAMLARVEETEVRLVNSRQQLGEDIEWEDSSCWIFVGGDVLQRGFAMQGLTVTWMPRSAGSGQVDVLMQRGRWFGYRAAYFDYCRVWLPEDVYTDYYALFADHEEALWRSLSSDLAAGKSLADWSRVFWLDPDPALRLCRLSSQWFRLRRQDEWISQLWVPTESSLNDISAAAQNWRLVNSFEAELPWKEALRPMPATTAQEHDFVRVPLVRLREFFDAYRFFGEDEASRAVVRDAVAVLLKANPTADAIIVRMRPNYTQYRRSQTGSQPKIASLLQSYSRNRSPNNPDYYPGDRAYHAGAVGIPDECDDLLTVQLHRPRIVRVQDSQELTSSAGYLAGGCPLVAVYLPESARSYRREGSGDRPQG